MPIVPAGSTARASRPLALVARLLIGTAAAATLLLARAGDGLPLYAARTGLMCQSCHFDPNGGGARNEFGFAFARARHSLAPDTSSVWKDLNLGNRVADNVPIYFGVEQRFMLLSNANANVDQAERAGFFNMRTRSTSRSSPTPACS